MSGPAMHRVLVSGPRDEHRLMLVLLNVADWPGTDLGERGHPVSQNEIAARAGISLWYCRKLMAQAVVDGWLACSEAPKQGQPGRWKLGERFDPTSRHFALSGAKRSRQPRTKTKSTSRWTSTDSQIDVNVVYVPEPTRPMGGRPAPGDSDVSPPPDERDPDGLSDDPGDADRDLGRAYLDQMRTWLRLRQTTELRSVPDPDRPTPDDDRGE